MTTRDTLQELKNFGRKRSRATADTKSNEKTAHSETRRQQLDRHKPVRQVKSTSLFSVQDRWPFQSQELRLLASSVFSFNRTMQKQVLNVPSSIAAEMTVRRVRQISKDQTKRDSNMISAGFPRLRKSRLRETSSAKRQPYPQSPLASLRHEGVVYFQETCRSTVLALSEALRRVEEWEEADSSTAGGSRTRTVSWLITSAEPCECEWPLLLVWPRHLLRRGCT